MNMQVVKFPERPPYVQFEVRDIEDRTASIEKGHYVGKDIDFAIITPPGSKDKVERPALDWLAHLDEMVKLDRFNADWARQFRQAYKNWKEDAEPSVEGYDLRYWPGVTPSQYKQMKMLRLRTVEDVATMNEETINRLGAGGRSLKDRARTFLETSQRHGVASEAESALRAENEDLRAQQARMQAQLNQLIADRGGPSTVTAVPRDEDDLKI